MLNTLPPLTLKTYLDCVPNEPQQKVLARLLLKEVKVRQVLSDAKIVGFADTAGTLTNELANLLGLECSYLPVYPLHLDGGEEIIYGAACALDDVLYFDKELLERFGLEQQAILSEIQRKKVALINRAQKGHCKLLGSNGNAAPDTVLLIDSAFIVKEKFRAAVQSLSNKGVSKIIPVTPFLYRPAVLGCTDPVRPGVYLKQFGSMEDLIDLVRRINKMPESEIETSLSATSP